MKELLKEKNYKRGTHFFNKGEYEKAIAEFSNSLKIYKDNPLIYANLGISYANLEQYDKAIEFLDRALEIDSNQAEVWDAKVTLLDKLGRIEDLTRCMREFDESVKKDPELIGIKPLFQFDPPLPEGLNVFSLGNVAKQPKRALIELVNYFLSLFQISKANIRLFYYQNELLIAIEEKPGVWMKSLFRDVKVSNLFNLYQKDII